jgi:hypothetical protein
VLRIRCLRQRETVGWLVRFRESSLHLSKAPDCSLVCSCRFRHLTRSRCALPLPG